MNSNSYTINENNCKKKRILKQKLAAKQKPASSAKLFGAEKLSSEGVCRANSSEREGEDKLVRSIFSRLKPNEPEVLSNSDPLKSNYMQRGSRPDQRRR